MRLKSFHAKSMTEAMALVKKSLGDDAVIVSTREEADGRMRVTAAIEQASPEPDMEKFDLSSFEHEESSIEELTEIMLKHSIPNSISEKIIAAASQYDSNDVHELLSAALDDVFEYKKIPVTKKISPIVLVGPPGAGKTLTTAKLSARAKLAGLNPAVITTDTVRAGGVEQLEAFLDLLQVNLLEAPDLKTLKGHLKDSIDADQIIIDTGGLNPFDPMEMKELSKILSLEDMDPILVLPAGGDAEESAEMAMTFAVLGVKKILPTRLDFARRLGGIIYAADKAGMMFTEASHTPEVVDGLIELNPDILAQFLIPNAS